MALLLFKKTPGGYCVCIYYVLTKVRIKLFEHFCYKPVLRVKCLDKLSGEVTQIPVTNGCVTEHTT